MFFNFDVESKEIEHQLQILASVEMLDDKNQAFQKSSRESKEFFAFLLPLYEQDYDLGSFAFVGKNGIKVIMIKKQDRESDNQIKLLLETIHNRYSNVICNPFYDKNIFSLENTSTIKNNFLNGVVALLSKK